MSQKFASAIDYSSIPGAHFVLENLASAPGTAVVGYTYYDTVLLTARVCVNATGPVFMSMNNVPASSSITSAMIVDGTIVDADINAAAAIAFTKIAAPSADFSMNTHKITNAVDPTSAQDVATKAYVDSVAAGFNAKAAVVVATAAALPANTYSAGVITATGNGALTVDGIAVTNGMRVLVKNEGTAANNGIYTQTQLGDGSHPYILTRSADAATGAASATGLSSGDYVFVEEGTANAASAWVLTTIGAITIGTTGVTWTQVAATTSYTGTTNQITITGNVISIATGYVGQTSITTVGTIGTGTWAGTAVAVLHGGTGATTAAAGLAALGGTTKYVQTLSTSSTSYTITHNLGTLDVICEVYTTGGGPIIECDMTITDTNTVTLGFAVAPTSSLYRVVVIG